MTFLSSFPCWHRDAELASTEANGCFSLTAADPGWVEFCCWWGLTLPVPIVTLDQSLITALQIQSYHAGSRAYPG